MYIYKSKQGICGYHKSIDKILFLVTVFSSSIVGPESMFNTFLFNLEFSAPMLDELSPDRDFEIILLIVVSTEPETLH